MAPELIGNIPKGTVYKQSIYGNFYFLQIIARFDPLMKVAANSYKSGIGWLYSSCSHQGRLITAPFGESLRVQAARLACVFLFFLYSEK